MQERRQDLPHFKKNVGMRSGGGSEGLLGGGQEWAARGGHIPPQQ